jgi:hypothetical protein
MIAHFSPYIEEWWRIRNLEKRFWIVGRSEGDKPGTAGGKPETLCLGKASPGPIKMASRMAGVTPRTPARLEGDAEKTAAGVSKR